MRDIVVNNFQSTIVYVFQQLVWLVRIGCQLARHMGVGIKWMVMTVRCVVFALLDLCYFIPHVLWYLMSPTIIRRVSYRSSKRTKMHNLEAFLSKKDLLYDTDTLLDATVRAGERGGGGPPRRREGSPVPRPQHHDEEMSVEVKREVVERLASAINPADGSFVNGIPLNLANEDLHQSMAALGATMTGGLGNMNNSFDDTLAALRKLYRRRSEAMAAQEATQAASGRPHTSSRQTSLTPGHGEEDLGSSFDHLRLDMEGGTTDSDEEDREDKENVHNRATLDIYLPVPLDTLFRFMDQERRSEEARKKRSSSNHGKSRTGKLKRKKFPILISVNGGAWIVGCYLWNFLIARVFAARGYVVFCPDYRNFPQTTMEGMTLDVSDAIAWVLNNAERYNGDLDNVTLIGQSAGAHLTMMSLLSQAQMSAYQENKLNGMARDVPPPSPDILYNVPRYNPRAQIRRYVGLSGIYNVKALVRHFDGRGLYRDVLYKVAGGRDHLPRFSVTSYFDQHAMQQTGEVLPNNIFDFLPRRMFFVHGDADRSAPITESANLVYMMRNAQRDAALRGLTCTDGDAKPVKDAVVLQYVLVPGANHTDSIIEEPLWGNSHIAEFICFYEDEEQHQDGRVSPSMGPGGTASPVAKGPGDSSEHSRVSSMQFGVTPSEMTQLLSAGPSSFLRGADEEDHVHPVVPVARPDRILVSPFPAERRPKLLRVASKLCPF